MGDNSTIFSLEVAPEGWFAKETQPHGWFDKDALDPASGGSSGSPYSLAVDTSAVTLTGSTIALRRALKLSVSTAAVTATGSSVALRTARKLAVSTAAVTATGSTVALKAARTLAVSTAAVTLTGSSITLTYATPNRRLAVDTAAITLTGSEIGLTYTPTATESTHDGGDGFSPAQVREYRKRKDKKRTAIQELERQIERTYNRIHGLEEPEAPKVVAATEKAATVIARAEQLVSALTAKESQSDRFSEEARGILSNINRLIAMVETERKQREQEEEEALVLLLAA